MKAFLIAIVALLTTGCATRGHDMTRELLAGNQAAIEGDFTGSVNHYENALKSVPSSAIVKRNLGIVLVKVGNYKRARTLLESVLPRYEKDVEVRYFLGEASRGLSDYPSAMAYYQSALRLDSKDLRVQKALAWTYGKIGNYDRSLAIVEPLLDSNPSDLQLRLIAANSFNRKKRYKEAVGVLAVVEKSGFKLQSRDRVSAESERVLLLSSLGEAYVGLNDCEKGTAMYQEVLRTRPLLASALTALAKCDLRNRQHDKALAKLEKAAKSDPEYPETFYLLAKYFEKTDAKKSAGLYRKFLVLARDNADFSSEALSSKSALTQLERRNSGRR